MRRAILFAAALGGLACATSGSTRRFEDMTPSEHLQAAEREHRLADEEFEKIHEAPLGPRGYGAETPGISPGTPVWDATSDPVEAEYYTIDPRIHDPSERHEDAARRHRERAERHEAAARRALGSTTTR